MKLNSYFSSVLIVVVGILSISMMRADYIMDLPIDVLLLHKKRAHLMVQIPSEFKKIDDTTVSTIHFVDGSENSWSKMVITQTAVGIAENCMKEIKTAISAMDILAQVLTDTNDYKNPYTSRRLIAVYYNPHKQREEALLARYFSGQFGCSGFQYIVAIKEGVSREAALQELEWFETESAHIKVY